MAMADRWDQRFIARGTVVAYETAGRTATAPKAKQPLQCLIAAKDERLIARSDDELPQATRSGPSIHELLDVSFQSYNGRSNGRLCQRVLDPEQTISPQLGISVELTHTSRHRSVGAHPARPQPPGVRLSCSRPALMQHRTLCTRQLARDGRDTVAAQPAGWRAGRQAYVAGPELDAKGVSGRLPNHEFPFLSQRINSTRQYMMLHAASLETHRRYLRAF
jgi:hypothetical protein